MWGILAAIAVAAILIAAILSRPRKHTVAEIDLAETGVAPELAQFIMAVNSENDPAGPAYVRAVEQLKTSRAKVIAEASRLLSPDSDSSFAVRHSALLALGALRDPDALDLLSAVALNPQPLPPKDDIPVALNPQPLPPVDDSRRYVSRDVHGGDDWVAGTMLALAALDGIKALADDGLAAANAALVEAAGIESNAVRAVALAALGASVERREYLERAAAGLPAGLRHLAQTRHAAVRDVPQVRDPRAHLAGAEAAAPGPPDLDGGAGQSRAAADPEHGAPRAGRS